MKQWWRKGTAMLLAAVMALCILPYFCGIAVAKAATVYGMTTADGVRVRKSASTSADYWFKLDENYVCEVKDEDTKEGIHWYKVEAVHPDPNSTRVYTGFIHGDYFRLLTDEETEAYKAGKLNTGVAPAETVAGNDQNAQPAAEAATAEENAAASVPVADIAPTTQGQPVSDNTVAASGATGKITNGGVNFRETEGGASLMKLDRGTIVEILTIPTAIDEDHWYKVRYDGYEGYIQAPFLLVVSNGDPNAGVTVAPTETNTKGYVKLILSSAHLRASPGGKKLAEWEKTGEVLPIAGKAVKKDGYEWYPVRKDNKVYYVREDCVSLQSTPGSTETATPAPTETPEPEIDTVVGYVKVTKGGSNLRLKPEGTVIKQVKKNSVFQLLRAPVAQGKYYWYYVKADGVRGYLRGDVVRECSETGGSVTTPAPAETASPADPTAAPSGGESKFLITTKDKVNLRAAAGKDSTAKFNVPVGTVMAWEGTTKAGGSIWYRVVYQNQRVWVLSTCIRLMSVSEYEAWTADHPEVTPQAAVVVGYVKTTVSGVNLRKTANGSILGRVDKGQVLPYDEEPSVVKKATWYHVKHPTLGYGYLKGDCVMTCNADGSALPTPTPVPADDPSVTPQEASYSTLMLGSSGANVKKLVQALIDKGFYKKSVTSSYTSAVESAVKAFQKSKGLLVDGIAGPETQHALFGTVPIGTNPSDDPGGPGTTTGGMTLYAAEKIDWYTGGIQQLWPKGANFQVYDVKTGIVWWAHRWSGGFHADCEPLTAADTAKLCKMYGVSSSAQIASKNMWERRPCLVTIGNRTFACSLYGIPHNYPEGDTIANNDFKGQLCIHFTNSRTHAGNAVDKYHTEAIQYAWEHAPNGHK